MSNFKLIADLRAAGLAAAEKRQDADPLNQIAGLLNPIARQTEADVLKILDGYAAGALTDPDEQAAANAAAAAIRRQTGRKAAID